MNRVRTFTHTPHIEDTLLCSFTHSVYTGLQLHTFCLFINAILATVTIADTFHWITKGVNAQAAEKCHHLCFFKLPVTFWIHFKFSERGYHYAVGHDITEQYLKGPHRAPSEGATSKGRPAKPEHWCSPKTRRMSIIMLQPSLLMLPNSLSQNKVCHLAW